MPSEKIAFRATNDLGEWLEREASMRPGEPTLSRVAQSSLMLFAELLGMELEREEWTLDELAIIAAALNGSTVRAGVGRTGELAQAVLDGADLSDPQVPALLDRLKNLGPTADQAMTRAVAQWWATGADHTVEGWTSVGVRVAEE